MEVLNCNFKGMELHKGVEFLGSEIQYLFKSIGGHTVVVSNSYIYDLNCESFLDFIY